MYNKLFKWSIFSKIMIKGLSWKKWKQGNPHLINRVQWNGDESNGLLEVLENDWFASGKKVAEFTEKFSKFTGLPYIVPTNSGSAAIELALLALKQEGRWGHGDLVLHPVTTFATSISSAINLGLTPVFIETKRNTYVADPEQVSRAVERYPNIRGMVMPYLIGNIPDIDAIKYALGNHRFLIEDSCDTLGGTYKDKHLGNFGNFGAFSFYASHHITSGGVGGAIGTHDKKLYKLAKSLAHWGRDFRPGDDEFLKRYSYDTLGLDAQMTELQAAFASKQMDKLPGFVKARENQFREMNEIFGESGFFYMPETAKFANPSWFAYSLTIKESAPFNRGQFARYATKNGIEIRPLMCGNITLQKPFQRAGYKTLDEGRFPVGDEVEEKSLFVPCWGMSENQKKDYYGLLKRFLDEGYQSR